MGARLVKFEICPEENQQVEAVVNVGEEKRSVIHGVVKDWNNHIVKDAVVKLFEAVHKGECCELIPLTHTFTDEYGEFMFGPLCPHKRYVIKVWFNVSNTKILVVKPDCELEDCISSKPDHNNEKICKTIAPEED